MPAFIGRDQVRHLIDEDGATVAEVLARAEYEWAHLSGAIHLPLKGGRSSTSRPTSTETGP